MNAQTRMTIAEFAEMVRTGQTTLEKAREEWPNLVLAPRVEPEDNEATAQVETFTVEDVERARAWSAGVV